MSVRALRRLVIGVCVVGIAGMIVTSILGHNGAAIAFGMVAAVAVLCSMTATAVTAGRRPPDTELEAVRVEELVSRLVAGGADEQEVRQLVRQAMLLGRSSVSA
jgi:hypothetical protein